MRSSSTTPSATRRARDPLRLILPTAAVVLALAGCAQGGPVTEPTPQESSVQSTPQQSAASGTSALLVVSVAQDADADPVQHTLECVDGVPGPASSLPGADAACAALARLGTEFFTARPDKDVVCTQQYGGPQTASITGELNGTQITASFALTDGCQISRWNAASDILGSPGAQ